MYLPDGILWQQPGLGGCQGGRSLVEGSKESGVEDCLEVGGPSVKDAK